MQDQNIYPNMGLMLLTSFYTKSIFDSSLKLVQATHPIWLESKYEIQYVAISMIEVSGVNFKPNFTNI